MEILQGTIVGISPLSETSCIVRWCSPEAGMLHTAARGARRAGSAFQGKIDLFFEADFTFVRSRRSTLHNLREVQVRALRTGVRRRYLNTVAAAYFVRLVELTSEPETPVPEQHGLLCRALDYLDGTGELRWTDILHFERELARILGLAGHGNPRVALSHLFGDLPRQRLELTQRLGSA